MRQIGIERTNFEYGAAVSKFFCELGSLILTTIGGVLFFKIRFSCSNYGRNFD